jgi:hypothetical protein
MLLQAPKSGSCNPCLKLKRVGEENAEGLRQRQWYLLHHRATALRLRLTRMHRRRKVHRNGLRRSSLLYNFRLCMTMSSTWAFFRCSRYGVAIYHCGVRDDVPASCYSGFCSCLYRYYLGFPWWTTGCYWYSNQMLRMCMIGLITLPLVNEQHCPYLPAMCRPCQSIR